MGGMLSDPGKDEKALTAFVTVLTRAFGEGSPVVGQSIKRRQKLAVVALRRIKSFERRGVSIEDRVHCIRDLAKGLAADRAEAGYPVGRLIADYQFLATELAGPPSRISLEERRRFYSNGSKKGQSALPQRRRSP